MKILVLLFTGLLCLAYAMPLPAAETTPVTGIQFEPAPQGWTIHAVSADAHELLTTFACASGLQLIVDDTVKRQVTIHIINKSATDVLNIIVDAYGFSTAEVNGVHIVSDGTPNSPSSYLLSKTRSVTTKYVSPRDARQLLPTFMLGKVMVSTDQNALVFSGPQAVLEKFSQDVEQFDIPAAQIMLDVRVVEFSNIDTDSFASLLGYSNAQFGITTDALTGQVTLNALANLPTEFFANLQALVEKREARVIANPSIATLSGKTASIFIGQQQYLNTTVNLPGRGLSNYIDAGVNLSVMPLTGGQGDIIIDLNEEISTLSAPDILTGLPNKTKRTARSQVRVRDGQTIIIGGLQQRESRSVQRAIPILGDLPVLGTFFRSKKTENTMVDMAVFITARILSNSGHLPANEEHSIKERFGIGHDLGEGVSQ